MGQTDDCQVPVIMSARTTHKVDITIIIVDEQQNRGTVTNVLADDGGLVSVKGVSGEINHGAHANGAPLVSAMGGNRTQAPNPEQTSLRPSRPAR